MAAEVTLTPEDRLETLWVLGERLRILGAPPGKENFAALVDVSPGAGVPLHRHASPELFQVLSGEITFSRIGPMGRQDVVAKPGDVVQVPAHAPHGYRNAAERPGAMLVLLDDAMAAFFRDIGQPAPPAGPPGPEDLARVGAACARHGVEMLEGPPG